MAIKKKTTKEKVSAKKATKAGNSWGWDNEPEPEVWGGPSSNRFFLSKPKKGQENDKRLIAFLTGAPYWIREHNYKKNGSWFNYIGCVKDTRKEGCPLCLAVATSDKKAPISYAKDLGVWEIIDLTGYKDKDGNIKNKNKKRYVTIPTTQTGTLKMWEEEYADGDLERFVFLIARAKEKAGVLGDFVKHKKRVSQKYLDGKLEEDDKESTIEEDFRKPTMKEIKEVLQIAKLSEEVSVDEDDEEVLDDDEEIEEEIDEESDEETEEDGEEDDLEDEGVEESEHEEDESFPF